MGKTVEWNKEFGTGGTLVCRCDCKSCSKTIKYKFKEKPDFKGANTKLKEKGWINRMDREEWYNFCSHDCFDKFMEGDKHE